MRKIFKRSLAAFLALVMALGCAGMTAFAETTTDGVWEYSVTSGKATVTGTRAVSANMSIGETVSDGLEPVDIVAVDQNVLVSNSDMEVLNIGTNVAVIGANSFSKCDKLKIVNIKGGSTQIQSGAFNDCAALETVYIAGPLTLTGDVFKNCHKDLQFIVRVDSSYISEAALMAKLSNFAGTWTAEGDHYVWSGSIAGKKVITSDTEITPDNTAPLVTIKVEDGEWNTAASTAEANAVAYQVDKLTATIKVKDGGSPASGINVIGYYVSETAVADPSALTYTAVSESDLKDGWYTVTQDFGVSKGIMYVKAEDKGGLDTFVNTPIIYADKTAPTGKVEILTERNSSNNKYTTSVELKFSAADTESGVASVSYYVKPYADEMSAAALAALAADQWTDTTDGATITVSGQGSSVSKYHFVYLKIVDKAGNTTYVHSAGFKPADSIAPVIKGEYYHKTTGALTDMAIASGKASVEAASLKITVSDNIDVDKFTIYKAGQTEAVTKVVPGSAGYMLTEDGVYTITAKDDNGNETKVEVTFKQTAAEDTKITITSKVIGEDGKAVDKTENAKSINSYNYPATVKVTGKNSLLSVTYTYKDAEKNDKTVDATSDASKGIELKDYNTYYFVVTDSMFKTYAFSVTIAEAEHKIDKLTVSGSDIGENNTMNCMGGTFSATVSGSDLYHKIALFNGTTQVGKTVEIGSLTEPVNTAEIKSGTFNLPANKTNKAIEYTIYSYPFATEAADITAAKGTKLAVITVSAYTDIFQLEPSSLSYAASGGTKEVKIINNITATYALTDSSWLSVTGASTDTDGFTILKITAAANTGIARTNSIVFTNKDTGKVCATLSVTQSAAGTTERLKGSGRVQTAIAISKEGWLTAKTVVLASGNDFADALAGVSLAGAVDGPILLTENKSNGLEADVLNEIARLGAKKVYILGGTASINSSIETALKANYEVERLKGSNRYGTAVAIATELAEVTGKPFTKLYFANAWNFPDALAVSAVAAIEGNPVLYMPTTGAIESVTSNYVGKTNCTAAYVIGGEGAVSKAGFDSLSGLGLTAKRVFGADRYATAVAVNTEFASVFTGKGVAIATGLKFPDALAGGALCAKLKMPIVLAAETDSASATAQDYIKSKAPDFAYVLGGTSAISENLEAKLAPTAK